jgi:addiction module HigA family antidote
MRQLAIHPGQHLNEELNALSMSAAELARQLGVPSNRISQLLRGERNITADTAMRLAHYFGTSAQFWMNLQSLYDLRVAEAQSGRTVRSLPTLQAASARG